MQEMCAEFWPGEVGIPMEFEDITISLISTVHKEQFDEYKLSISVEVRWYIHYTNCECDSAAVHSHAQLTCNKGTIGNTVICYVHTYSRGGILLSEYPNVCMSMQVISNGAAELWCPVK